MYTAPQKAPGLHVRQANRNGTPVFLWRAQPALIAAGFLPKNVRLHYASANDPALIARCHFLQKQMLEWAASKGKGRAPEYDGSVASLWRYFETHPDSPYHRLQPQTQIDYSKTVKRLIEEKGKRLIDNLDGPMVRRWYDERIEAGYSRGWTHHVMTVFKCAVSFGAAKKFPDCAALSVALSKTRLRQGKARTQAITYEQVRAYREKARELGMEWSGLCVTIQFELALRRRDVIGIWRLAEPEDDRGIRTRPRNREWIWKDGIQWSDIDRDGVLTREVSKTRFTSGETAVHDISRYPELAAELRRIPAEKQVGPIVIHPETGVPPTDYQCRRAFRKIARAAGIPDAVWNMDARAGAVSEADEAGATTKESMTLSTHTTRANNNRYSRAKLERSRRVAGKRMASREG